MQAVGEPAACFNRLWMEGALASITFLQVSALVGGLAAIMSIGVSIGVYITKIPGMQKQIDEMKDEHRKDRDRWNIKFEKHDEAISEVEKSIVGIETNVEALLQRSTANGLKLDKLFGLLALRLPAAH